MTIQNIIEAIRRQDEHCGRLNIKTVTPCWDGAHLAIYDYAATQSGEDDWAGTTAAVVYEDGTCLTRDDWQDGQYPECPDDIEDYEWYDFEHGRRGVMFNGLPRV